MELFKIMGGLNVIENYRSCFANLSMPMFCFTEPGPCKKYSYGGHEWSEWDHIVFDKTKGNTFSDLDTFLQQEYHVMLDSVLIGSKYLYNQFVKNDENGMMSSRLCKNVLMHQLSMLCEKQLPKCVDGVVNMWKYSCSVRKKELKIIGIWKQRKWVYLLYWLKWN